MVAAHRAIRIPPQFQFAKTHSERVIEQEPALKCRADPKNNFRRLGGLYQPDDARQDAQHSAFGTAWN